MFGRIIPSPIKEHAFWLTNQYGIAYEFDPSTGSWQDLEKVLDKFAIGLMGGESILKDPFEPDIAWIGNPHYGLIRYRISTGGKQIFSWETYWPGHGLTAVQPEKDRLWIGTTGGLWYYDRNAQALRREERLKDIWIRSIDKEGGRLWINGEFIFDVNSGTVVSVYDLPQHPSFKVKFFHLVEGYKVFKGEEPDGFAVIMDPKNEIMDSIQSAPMDLVFMDSTAHLWFCGPRCVRWKIGAKSLDRVPDEISAFRRMFETDRYFYFTGQQFLRWSTSGTAVDQYWEPAYDFIADADQFWVVSKGCLFHMRREGLDELFQSYIVMSAPNPADHERADWAMGGTFLDLLKGAARHFRENLPRDPASPLTDEEDRFIYAIKEAESADLERLEEFASATQDLWERQFAYFGLITKPVASGNLALSMKYLQKLREEFPDTTLWRAFAPEDLPRMDKTWREYQAIQRMSIPEDERLWRLGGVLLEGFQLSFNVSVVYYILDYPLGVWEELLKKYPNSPWADDAEYEIMEYRNGGDDGQVSLEGIEAWEGYIKKYPDSAHVPDARMMMAGIHMDYCEYGDFAGESPSPDAAIGHLTLAREICAEVPQKYPGTPHEDNARQCLENVDQELDRRALRLTIRPEKESYVLGDPVRIRIEVKNVSPKERKVELFPDPPNFSVRVKYVNSQVPFVLDAERQVKAPSLRETVLAAKGGAYVEVQELQRLSLSIDSQYGSRMPGHYQLDWAGLYRIQACFQEKRSQAEVCSDEIEVTLSEIKVP